MKTRSLLVFAFLSSSICGAGATTYTYNLDGNLNDSTGGGPSLIANGGTLSATGYTFDANKGLTLSNLGGSPFTSYTIDISFDFSSDTTARGNGYRRILDFQNSASDNGLYSLGHDVNFYPGLGTTGPNVLTNNQLATVSISRNSLGHVTVSVGGNSFGFDDTSGFAVFTPLSNLNFFIDDNAVPGEAAAGFVNSITITTDQVASPVPGPIVGAGLPGLVMALGGLLAWRRRKAAQLPVRVAVQ